jgi:hypothetical protein
MHWPKQVTETDAQRLDHGVRPLDRRRDVVASQRVTIAPRVNDSYWVSALLETRDGNGFASIRARQVSIAALLLNPWSSQREANLAPDRSLGDRRLIQLNVPTKELAARKKKWKAPKPRYKDGVLAEYARHVSSASKGAIAE